MSVTVKDLAAMTGISTSTISRVLSGRGYVKEETRQIVEAAAKASGYQYKKACAMRNSVKMVMMIMGEVSNDIYAQSIRGIASIFDAHNIMYVGTYGDRYNAEKLEFYMRHAISNHFEGMILFTPIETPSFIRMMKSCSIPCIALNRPLETIEMDEICMDNKAAGRLAVEYLYSKGHTRIAHLTIPGYSSVEYRTRGFISEVKRLGLEFCDSDIIPAEDTFESGVTIGSVIAVSKKDITAVYAPNEGLALGVIEGLRRCGKRVPEDISVIATDNSVRSIQGNITTVSCNHYEMGVQAALLFIERSKNLSGARRQIFLTPEIVERESVRDIRDGVAPVIQSQHVLSPEGTGLLP